MLVAFSYLGLFVSFYSFGDAIFEKSWSVLQASWGQNCAQIVIDCFSREKIYFAPDGWSFVVLLLHFTAGSIVLVSSVLFTTKGIVFSAEKVKPKLNKISLLKNAKNKFGLQGIFEFIKSFAKMLVYGLCCCCFIIFELEEVLGLLRLESRLAMATLFALILRLMGMLVVIAMVFGLIDFAWQYFNFMRKNRMSLKEMRDEHKESEGDPHFKQKRIMRGREIALNHMIEEVKDADVIIVNPTHYAVALKWSKRAGEAPVCVAKGVDHVAMRIREAASAADIAIFDDPPTARALYAGVKLGDEIEPEFYLPVAAAIRFANEIRARAKRGIF